MTVRRLIANVLRNLCDRMDPPRRPAAHTIHFGMDMTPERLAEIRRAIDRQQRRTSMHGTY